MTGPFRSRLDGFEMIGLALALVVLALALNLAGVLNRWDLLLYDWCAARQSRTPAEDIVIVAIDEQSLRQLGRWPWSRRVHADLVRKLTAAGAKAVALDIVFAEPDAADPAADRDLATALADNGRVVLPVVNEQIRLNGQLIETLPIPALAQAVAGLGHVDVELDPDGIARGVFLKAGLGSPRWSTLALAVLETVDPSGWQAPPGQRTPATHLSSPNAWRRDYHVLIPFAGPPGHFQRASYRDVLRGDFAPTLLRDKFVLVGVTATGIGDMLPTPVGQAQPMPGVEFNANVLDALRRGLTIQPLPRSGSLLLTGILVLLPLALYAVSPPRWTLPLAGLALLATFIVGFLLLHVAHRWFPSAAALLVQGSSYPLWSWRRLQQSARALFVQKEHAQATLHSIGDAVIAADMRGVVEYLNPAAESLLGCTLATARGQPLDAIFHLASNADRQSRVDLVALCLERKQLLRLPENGVLVTRAGREYAVRASAKPIRDQREELLGVVVAFGDITEASRLTEQMAHQATHDALTQLPNRYLLQDRLKHAIARARRTGWSFAVLFVDLDHFKKVNDGLGHGAGDILLREVAARLLGCGRKEDTIARLGGDEFVIVLEDLRQEDRAATLARKILEALALPLQIEGHECFITASIGVSLFPKDGADAETLLKNADAAMYQAKDSGRDIIQFYGHEMHARALERLKLEQSLRHALERRELELHYQPQMELRGGRIIGVEALLRWRHPQRGLISPSEFVPLAEETGLIEVIGEWVLRTACEQARAWQREGLPPLRMAVNLSPRQFLRPGMANVVDRVLRETGLEPGYLDLEITEGLLIKNVEGSIATLRALKAMGVRLSIDDFGTGYSSLNYLKRFPIDQLKIDKSFVSDLMTDQDDNAIALAVIAMAHSMRLNVIAEGVENESQLAFLQKNLCDEMQGYYLSRPLPPRQLTALLRGELPSAALRDPNSRRPTG
jgi:diguanylate cyclase (GGDEF)-like protein/PAS domain S-box-containing protein